MRDASGDADDRAGGAQTPSPAIGNGWGDPIAAPRIAALDDLRRAWEATPAGRPGPFAGRTLSGADVFWLAVSALAGPSGDTALAEKRLREAQYNALLRAALDLSAVNLQGAVLGGIHLRGAILRRVHLEHATLGAADLTDAFLAEARLTSAYLDRATLARAYLSGAHLDRCSLYGASLKDAVLYDAHLDDAILREADLQHADLRAASLRRADLTDARLQNANLGDAHLEQAILYEAHLASAVLRAAHFEGADLRRAVFDDVSRLNDAHLDHAALDQASFAGTNLAVVNWANVHRLGDEVLAGQQLEPIVAYDAAGRRTVKHGRRKPADTRTADYLAAGRAYRSLSVSLLDQGLSRAATRFHFRAEVMGRKASFYEAVARLRTPWGLLGPLLFFPWLLSLLLGIAAGYGIYHVWRLVVTYLAIVAGCAAVYYVSAQQGHMAMTVLDALLLSVTSFHGRGLQPPSTLNDTMRAVAGVEAVGGLLVEALFIAAFTRRVTGS